MSYVLLRWAINAIALWVSIQLVPGIHHTGSGLSLLGIALVFGLVNALVRPFLLLLTCPFVVLTLGLFVFVVNTVMLYITAWLSGPDVLNLGLTIEGFWSAFFGAVIISLVSGVINLFVKDSNEREGRYKSKKQM